jgi:hypothetical protein
MKEPSMPSTRSLNIPGLETVYDLLAAAIDEAGPEKSELMLVKLALLSANALGDPDVFRAHHDAAVKDL